MAVKKVVKKIASVKEKAPVAKKAKEVANSFVENIVSAVKKSRRMKAKISS